MGDQARPPVGFRFRPTQQELIFLLQQKARGSSISTITNYVLEKNLYGKEGMEPWMVFSDFDNDKWGFYDDFGKNDKKRVLYVVTQLSKMSAKKVGRTAGRGTWDGQTKGQPVWDYEESKIVGYVRLFNYMVEAGYESEATGKGHWYMHEYSLSEDSLKEIKVKSTDYVVCRIVKDDSKSCTVKSFKKKNVKARGVNHEDRAIGSSQVEEELPTTMNDQCGTSRPSMPPQQDYGISGSTLEQQYYGASFQKQQFPQYDGTTGGGVPQAELQEYGAAEARIVQEEFPQCYLTNKCLAPSGDGDSFFDLYNVGDQINTGYYYDATNSTPGGMNSLCVQNQEITCLDAENYVQQNSDNTLSTGQFAQNSYNDYDPSIHVVPNQEIYYSGHQQISSGTCLVIQEMDAANQPMMGTCPRVEDNSVIVIDDKVTGACPEVEDDGVIVIDEDEENLQHGNVDKSVNSSPANNNITAMQSDDLMDLEQDNFQEILKSLQSDESGFDTALDT